MGTDLFVEGDSSILQSGSFIRSLRASSSSDAALFEVPSWASYSHFFQTRSAANSSASVAHVA